MSKPMTPQERALEEFRHFYLTRHGMRLDDELLLLLMRMSEMHRDLRREVRRRPVLQFRSPREYLWHGFGRVLGLLALLWAIAMTVLVMARE
jgi:hypothetical protein